MKSAIAGGIDIDNLGQYNYQNLNYGLCRMLLPVINGNINKNANFGSFPFPDWPFSNLNDNVWDVVTISAYEAYLQAKVFQPSGVVGATLDHPPECALAYRDPTMRSPAGTRAPCSGAAAATAGIFLSTSCSM